MAITICSSPNPSPTLPSTVSLSSLPTKSSLKTPTPHHLHHPPFLSSSKLSFGLVYDDAPTIAEAAEAMALANAAAQAARDALGFAQETQKIVSSGENGSESEVEREWKGVFGGVRRKRRRKRRKGLEIEEKKSKKLSLGFSKSGYGYLTRQEEAEYSLCLKEEAMVEAARRRLVESNEHFPTSNQLAKAIGMSKSSLDEILCNGRESRERITCSYKRLVVSVASSYQGRGLSLQDLIQEGSIGLLRGAERFNPERGNKMSTYVYWWIRQAITSAIAKKSRIIRLPGSMCEMVPKIAEANTSLSRRLRRFPTHREIAEVVDMDASSVRLVLERSRAPISLDHAVTSRGCMTLQEVIQGPDETTPSTMMNKQLMKREVEKLLATLHEREANVLRLHYGLNGETTQSFEEIGRQLKLSRERVRQINRTALSKLQQSGIVDNLKFFLV